MSKFLGTVSMGLVAPIIKEGDDMVKIATDTLLNASKGSGFEIEDRDVIALTESIVARAQGNYASIEQVAKDIKSKLDSNKIGVVFPILSRNRFSLILKSIASSCDEVIIQFSYPSDEVGNHFVTIEQMEQKGIDPYTDIFEEDEFVSQFEDIRHKFTGVNYVEFYKEIVNQMGAKCRIMFANSPTAILKYTDTVIAADIHTRERTKKTLKKNGAKKVLGLDDIMIKSVDGSGYNEKYGLLGSNKATEDTLKLFPYGCQELVENIQKNIKEKTGKKIEVMVYGDGAFKDPVGKIWEFADPVVSPGYTSGLKGTPSEIKLKYVVDNEMSNLGGKELEDAVKDYINKKDKDLVGKMASEGTTPRQLTDLLGSLADLTSGSGDKGTPIVYIKGYFTNYSD